MKADINIMNLKQCAIEVCQFPFMQVEYGNFWLERRLFCTFLFFMETN